MSPELALRDLLADAEYYILNGLIGQIAKSQDSSPPGVSSTSVSDVEMTGQVSPGPGMTKRLVPLI